MTDNNYIKNHKIKKEKIRELLKKVKETKGTQEIYHKIIGSKFDEEI
jgi:hypothetical protein